MVLVLEFDKIVKKLDENSGFKKFREYRKKNPSTEKSQFKFKKRKKKSPHYYKIRD